ncbi:MAG TPA: ATP-binding protein [Dokdonella sp.]|uniref:sensor histidine kinase n=1 Tax=Dokdonella sp. TaxID=2291710 RepID=UPI002CE508F0|nr:ATP-binding protein [Dokdonella sp.]HUD41212.1 ATP-binding protein [Dokdonella sp.]
MSESRAAPTAWYRLRRWLASAPIGDPVDRRNAPMLQIVLIVIGCVPPLMWLYRITASALPWRPGETASMLMSLSLSTMAWIGLAMIRRGRFRAAASLVLGVVALLMVLSYATSGLGAQTYEQPIQVVWIAIAGLVLGRRALWWMYGWMIVAFAIGFAVDVRAGKITAASLADEAIGVMITATLFLLIAIVIDRAVAALRESLGEANRRGNELVRINRRLEAEIAEHARVREQLFHAQKVEAVGRLASGIAHDFNNLLGLMLGYAQRSRNSREPDELRRSLDGMESAARRAASITQNLLNFSRSDATRIEILDAGPAVREMEPMLVQLLDPSIRMRVTVAGSGPLPVRFDPAQFALVALNIAANANHAMPDGGRFEIDVRPNGPDVDIVFTDSGPGIASDLHERIFEPFFTTKPSGQGTGLGLAVAANLVRNAGGTLSVENAPDAGARFRMRLPRVDSAAARAANRPAPG